MSEEHKHSSAATEGDTYLSQRLRHIAGQLINGTVEDGAVECGLLCAAADEIDRLSVSPQAVSVAVDTTDYTELRASLADNITLFSHHKAALLRLVDAKIASTLSRPK